MSEPQESYIKLQELIPRVTFKMLKHKGKIDILTHRPGY